MALTSGQRCSAWLPGVPEPKLGIFACILAISAASWPQQTAGEGFPGQAGSQQLGLDGSFTVRLHRQLIPLHVSDGAVHHKSAYYGELELGGPDVQLFQVVFDTGSGHLILPSALCRSETCLLHQRYRRRASLLAQDIDANGEAVSPGQPRDQITVSFGTGEVTGVFVKDQVCLGPGLGGAEDFEDSEESERLQGRRLTAPSLLSKEDWQRDDRHGCVELRFISATHMTQDPFASFAFDGVLGLGLVSLSQAPAFNFMTAAVSAGAWRAADPDLASTFAVFLGKSSEEQSEITFGGWRPEHVLDGAGPFSWCRVLNAEDGYWQLEVRGLSVGGRPLDFCSDGGCRAIVDTGTSLLGVPSELGAELGELLRHAPSETGDCGGPGPGLEVDLGNFTVRLGPEDFSRPELEALEPAAGPPGSCVPMLMYIDLPAPMAPRTLILGEPVLQKYYTAFQAASSPRVGFVAAKHSSHSLSDAALESIRV